ncbi:hypothetical protein BCR42DRAFT_401923 [Absidia repens]|uniref:Swiss Army Knife 2H phosphoesterase domain-containing protein n=1 Tax=Absidia repens TaxID=90262 RepID=A0A1X2IZ19_9FUNG|nr:hypothetical protein BCR42DRAFT_401923 [Absidia repens]
METKRLDLVVAGSRYLSIVGDCIDTIGRNGKPATMPLSYHQNRVDRDKSNCYHITFAHNLELKKYMNEHDIPKKQRSKHLWKMIKSLVENFGDPSQDWELPVDFGLGRLEEKLPEIAPTNEKENGTNNKEDDSTMTQQQPLKTHVSYFRVIHWPFGQKLRAHFGLPPTHFHVTVGFDPKDIHSPKGPNTLLLKDGLNENLIQRWVKTALDYPDQTIFLHRLYDCLILSDRKELAEPWLHLLQTSTPQIDRSSSEETSPCT